MMRSLNSGVAGLRSHQTKMDVIGSNIANVNTYGFKSSRATFADVYYQTLSSGSAPMATIGGTNPTQIGYGSAVATIDVMNSVTGPASTDRALDLYINGEGMIATKDADGNLFYTRLGITGFDAEGNLVDGNGHFIMGAPYDADGNPQFNADGSVDIENLSRIQVDPELLDQMTNISIGTTGQIVGTLAGDTEISVSKKIPAWLIDVQIDPESDVVGDVKVTMEYRSTFDEANLPSWIKSLSVKPNSKLEGSFQFTYAGTTITATNPDTNEVLTGTYRQNGTVSLSNAKGEVVMTIQTDALNVPDATAGEVTLSVKQMLRVDWTDKGGNADFAEVEYIGQKGDITLGDITLTIDGDQADEVTTASLVYDTANPFHKSASGGFIEGVYFDPDSLYSANELQLGVGSLLTVNKGISGNAYLKFLVNNDNLDTYEAMCKELASVLPGGGVINMEIDDQGASGFRYLLKDANNTTLATSGLIKKAGDSVVFTNNTSTPTASWTFTDKVGAEQFRLTRVGVSSVSNTVLGNLMNANAGIGKATLTVGGASPNHTITLTMPDGTPLAVQNSGNLSVGDSIVVGTGPNAVTLGTLTAALVTGDAGTPGTTELGSMSAPVLSNQKFGTITAQNTLRLYDENGKMLAETNYSGQTTIALGDLSLTVDKDALLLELANGNNVEDATKWQTLGTLDRETGPDWEYNNNAANAQPGSGEAYLIGNIALAKIPNMVAMQQAGDSYFTTTANSGEAIFLKPGINGTGTLNSGYLEMSNVDISKEFTEMITTQRGFQANTRIITVSDEMLNELVNLKR